MKKYYILFNILLLFTAANISAKTIIVTSSADSGTGSLREAIETANDGDVIVFDNNITTVTISSSIKIEKSITINGSSSNYTTIIAAANPYIFSTVKDLALNVAMNYLTIKDWRYYSSCTGVIAKNDDGTLTVSNCNFTNNIAPSSMGPICSTRGITVVNNCSFKGNQGDNGGAIYIGKYARAFVSSCTFEENNAQFGVVQNFGYVEIDKCIFRENTDASHILGNREKMIVSNCLFEENLSGNEIFSNKTEYEATINNCLFVKNTNNSTSATDNLYDCGTIYNLQGTLNIINTTIAGNFGVGITNKDILALHNNIITENIKNHNQIEYYYDIYSETNITATNNLIGRSNTDLSSNNNLIGEDPLFTNATSGDYSLRESSPAIDKGNNTYLSLETTTDLADMPRISNTTVDLGAYEYQQEPIISLANTINEEEVKIYTQYRNIIIENTTESVQVYNINGQLITQGTGMGSYNAPQAGVYIVKVGNKARKVIVK